MEERCDDDRAAATQAGAARRVPRIVVVDDEVPILDSLHKIFGREGFSVRVTDNGDEALDMVRASEVDLVLADIMMPKFNGIELLRAIKAVSPTVEVVMMTAFGNVENAVECMRHGAYDFISKPLKRAIVVRSVQRALERHALVAENRILKATISDSSTNEEHIIGNSPALRATLETIGQVAPSDATVLLEGESGTGKEVLAKRVHRLSNRAPKPFVAINCAALPEALLESELFGHERGAFTGASNRRQGRFARADGGTILLDEVVETSLAVQVRLLRVLQEGEIEPLGADAVQSVDVRVIAASNKPLEAAVEAGTFREDLYYRLNVIRVDVPPLRERLGDVALLAEAFLRMFCRQNQKNLSGFSAAALNALDAYSWPGNVRELKNAIERAVVLSKADIVPVDVLPDTIVRVATGSEPGRAGDQMLGDGVFIPHGTTLEEAEKLLLDATLLRCGGDKKTAARLLGIAARTVYRKLGE